MGSSVRMKTFLSVLAATLFAQNLGHMEDYMGDAQYNCPLNDIDFFGHNLDIFYSIGSWQECAHICNIAYTSNCKFWTYNHDNCYVKSSDAGLMSKSGVVSGERGCTG